MFQKQDIDFVKCPTDRDYIPKSNQRRAQCVYVRDDEYKVFSRVDFLWIGKIIITLSSNGVP
jgi:hypothetical protein